MKTKLIAKFVVLTILTLAISSGIFAQTARAKAGNLNTMTSAKWKTYTLCEGAVQVDLPAMPTEQLKTTEVNGVSVTDRINTVRLGNSVFIIDCFDNLPIGEELLTPEVKKLTLDIVTKDFARGFENIMLAKGFPTKVKLSPIQPTLVNKYPAHQRTLDFGSLFKGTAKLVFFENGGFWGMAVSFNSKDKTAFFDSLKIVK